MPAIIYISMRIPPGTSEAKIAAATSTLAAMLSGEEPAAYVKEPVQNPTLFDRVIGRDHYVREIGE